MINELPKPIWNGLKKFYKTLVHLSRMHYLAGLAPPGLTLIEIPAPGGSSIAAIAPLVA